MTHLISLTPLHIGIIVSLTLALLLLAIGLIVHGLKQNNRARITHQAHDSLLGMFMYAHVNDIDPKTLLHSLNAHPDFSLITHARGLYEQDEQIDPAIIAKIKVVLQENLQAELKDVECTLPISSMFVLDSKTPIPIQIDTSNPEILKPLPWQMSNNDYLHTLCCAASI